MNIVEKLRLMQTDHIPELGEAIAEIEHLRREAHAWSKACEDATTKLYKLSTHHPRLEVRYWTGKYWEPLYGARFHEVLNALDLTPTPTCADCRTERTETMTTTPIAAGPNDVTVRPAAWMHDQSDRFDVIHAEAKALWLKAWPKQVEHYTIPLYRHQERQPLSTDDACALLRNVLGIDPVLDDNSRLKAWMYAATMVAAKIGDLK